MTITLTKTVLIWRLGVDDDRYELNVGDITPAQASALRLSSHGAWRVPTLLEAIDSGIGPEEVCGLVFLARRQAGEEISYDAVVAQVEEAATFTLDFGSPDDAEPAPAPVVGEVVADPES